MTDTASAQPPVTANFINPEAMHHPAGYTHVVEVTAGRLVYIAGQVALDRTGALVGPGDIGAQARQVFDNLQAALQAVGAGFEQVVNSPTTWSTPPSSPSSARSATSTSTSSSHRPAPPWRSGGWSAMTCSSRSKRSPWSRRSSP
jgi:enamine deaminase RidA (YjgF/YER057c/UK114 family)